MEENKKNGKKVGFIIAIAVLAAALAGVGVWAALTVLGNTPKNRLLKGFRNLSQETEAYQDAKEESLGWAALRKAGQGSASYTDLSLDVTIPEKEIPTVGFDLSLCMDTANKLGNMDMALSVGNMPFLQAQLMADDHMLYLACPDLLENKYRLDTENLAENFNNSLWADLTGMTLSEEDEVDLWAAAEQEKPENIFSEGFLERETANLKAVADSMIVEKTDDVLELDNAGKKIVCKGIRVQLSKDALNQILADVQEEMKNGTYGELVKKNLVERMGGQLEDMGDIEETWEEALTVLDGRLTADPELVFYLDGKSRIMRVETVHPIGLDHAERKIEFSADFKGAERTLDSVSAELAFVGADTEDVSLVYSHEADIENCGFAINLQAGDGRQQIGMEADWELKSIEKGKSCVLDIGSAALSVNGERVLKLSGTVETGIWEQEIQMPQESVDILAMSEMEMMSLAYEVLTNIQDMMNIMDVMP